jgi:hypothetical protein
MRRRPSRAALGWLAGLVVAWLGIAVVAAAENGGQASSGAVVQSVPPPVSFARPSVAMSKFATGGQHVRQVHET